MSNLAEYAKAELERAGLFRKDSDYDGMLGEDVMELIKTFSQQGHSGMSAEIPPALFEKVARYLPLTPLTGDDDEWNEGGSGVLQNRRCSHVFKENGQAYDQHGKVFREPDGICYTSRDSRVPITFPYTPKTEYVDVPK